MSRKIDWKKLNIGDTVLHFWNEFDGSGSIEGTVSQILDDHIIITTIDGEELWCDDDFADMYKPITTIAIGNCISSFATKCEYS